MRLDGLGALSLEQLREGAAGEALNALVEKLACGGIGLDHLQAVGVDDENGLGRDLE